MFGFGKVTREAAAQALADGLRTGDFRAAVKQYRKLAEQHPDDHKVHHDLGFALLEAGDTAGAVGSLRRANELQESPIQWNNLGRALLRQREFGEAKRAFQRARDLDGSDPQPWYNLTVALREEGDTEGSFRELGTLCAAHPRHAGSRNDLATHYLMRGQRDMAAEQLRSAIDANPDYAPARLNLIRLLCEAGRYPDSTEHLEHLAKLGANVVVSAKDGKVEIVLNGKMFYRGTYTPPG